ncbi:MAG: homoserine dehydrogenase [Planctomycetota bacterium]|nr:homoserine dehydrogenase [Planctomycetota bacterium]MDG2083901.1 homoserine dehydrogenase [Planctomycetota bacterium]
MNDFRIALLGLGTVGTAVAELLATTRDECLARAERPVVVDRIIVRNLDRPRSIPEDLPGKKVLSSDPMDAVHDPEIDAIVELVGGEDHPRIWIKEALESGKNVITANKAVLAIHGEELFKIALEQKKGLYYEASVAAAVPVLQVIQQGIPAGPVDRLMGILNGTCNYILDSLEENSFEHSVELAQKAGLAEADPTLDVSGMDSAHKLALLARILLGYTVSVEDMRVEGIVGIDPIDLSFGWSHDLRLKLVGVLARNGKGTSMGVMPCFLPADHPLSNIRQEDNAILLEADPFGSLVLQGKGAGGKPTAGSVVADILRAARGDTFATPFVEKRQDILDPGAIPMRHYLRLDVPDRPGVLARVAGALASEEVGIAALEQSENLSTEYNIVPVQILTHPVSTIQLDKALERLDEDLKRTTSPVRIRIEE